MSHVQLVNDDSFKSEVLNSSQPVLVDCFAPWCGPCRMLAPLLDQLASEFDGRATIVKIDVDQSPTTARALRIQAMPTLILFDNGQEVDRIVGAPPAVQLRKLLSSRTVSTSVAGA